MRFRIAPTPSGYLHPGNAFNFILTALLARTAGASLRLRIDDGDATRARAEYLADIFEGLHWLGIGYDAGPRDAADHAAHFTQGLRTARYGEYIQRLVAAGSVFACNCSRKDILFASPDGQYPGTCRGKNIPSDTTGVTLRLHTPRDLTISVRDEFMGPVNLCLYDLARDPVIRRRDGLPAYHIASLADDLDHGITHIVRGEDLLPSTAVQCYLSQLLGGTAFDDVRFLHHPLLTDGGGSKLSKSAGSDSMHAVRARGGHASEVYQQLSGWMRWPCAVRDAREALEAFAQFGYEELKRLHGLHRPSR